MVTPLNSAAPPAALAALEVTLDLKTAPPAVRCQFRPPAGAPAVPLGRLLQPSAGEPSFSTADFHLPECLDSSLSSASLTIPQALVNTLKTLLAAQPVAALSLDLVPPSGYLGLVPWERLLQPALGLPIVRPSAVAAGPPAESPATFEVALCSSSPLAKAPIDIVATVLTAASQIVGAVSRPACTVHIFTDQAAYEQLRQRLEPGLAAQVRLHDPASAASYAIPPASGSIADPPDRLLNPWLLWMRAETSKRGLDLVHFIARGYVSLDQGAIALAPTPVFNRDPVWSRFIGPVQLSNFLLQTGAWAAFLSSPPGASDVGLRLLAERAMQRHSFTVVHHDLAADPSGTSLAAAYRFVSSASPVPPPASPDLVLYCQPSQLASASPAAAPFRPSLEQHGYLIRPEAFDLDGDAIRGLQADRLVPPPDPPPADPVAALSQQVAQLFGGGRELPPWMLAAQRYVEQRIAELSRWQAQEPAGSSGPRTAAIEGVQAALQQIQQLILRHAGGS